MNEKKEKEDENQELENYKKAGRIAKQSLEFGLSLIEENASLLEVVEKIERFIKDKGAEPAFPVNVSINDRAAHYTASVDDKTVFSSGDVVKLDIGVHVQGYIGDVARTKIIGNESEEKEKLVEASEKALENAISFIKPGVKTGEIGKIIEETIRGYGFNPVVNLTGHKLKRYELHCGIAIPNIYSKADYELKEGEVFAIEPFATNGAGKVKDENTALIFRYERDARIRLLDARKILEHVKERYRKLPFAERWVADLVPKFKLGIAIRNLVESKALHAYKILREEAHGIVSQAEDTVIVTEDGAEILTRI